MKTILSTLLLSLLATTAFAVEHTKESLDEIQKKIQDKKGVLVDVREKREWDRGHVKGAILLPFSKLRDGITKEELKPLPKDKILYLHCMVGYRAKKVGELLENKGYKVRPIKPGYPDLISAGFPKDEE